MHDRPAEERLGGGRLEFHQDLALGETAVLGSRTQVASIPALRSASQIPAGATIVKVQFALNSGMGPDTGQWNV